MKPCIWEGQRLGCVNVSFWIHGLFLTRASLELHQQKPGSVASASKNSCLGTLHIHGVQRQLCFGFPVRPDELAYVFFMVWMWVTLKSFVCWSLSWPSSSGGKWLSHQDSNLINILIHLWIQLVVIGEWGTSHWRQVYEGLHSFTLSLSSLCPTCSCCDVLSPQPRNNGVRGPWKPLEQRNHSKCSLKLFFSGTPTQT